MWLFDKKWLILISIVTIVVVALANLELFLNKINASIKVKLPKGSDIIILKPSETGLDKNVYVFNTKNVNDKAVNVIRGVSIEEYDTQTIHEHIASKVYNALSNIGKTVKHLPISYTPMNDIFRAMCYGSDLLNTVDPLCADNETEYRIMFPKGSTVIAFIDDGYVYVHKTKNNTV